MLLELLTTKTFHASRASIAAFAVSSQIEEPMQNSKWKLQGRDTFANEDYPLEGEFDTEHDAITAAKVRLTDLEITQPSETSGGQDGIQDQVFVIRPDGTRFRVRF